MSRYLSADFEKLLVFMSNYNLQSVLSDEALLPIVSMIHKKYFALLALLIELNSHDIKNNSFVKNDDCKDYLFESLSDLGNSFFLTLNGGYKASKLMLRSSIETFVKGISADVLPNIVIEKRVYQVFECASKLDLFLEEPLKSDFKILKSLYSDLCEDTHTARKSNMQHVSSLNYFPTKDFNSAQNVSKIFISLVQSYIFIISMKFNKEFHQIHYINKTSIINTIKKSNRPIVLNLK